MKYIFQLRTVLPLLLVLCITSSCQDYLKDELLSETSVEYLYNTPDGLEDAVVGLYALNRELTLDSEWNYARSMTIQAKSDLVFGRTGEIALYAYRTWGRRVGDFGAKRYSRFWRHYYRVVDRSNAVITAAEALDFPDADDTRKNQIIAEAKAMRAHNYFYLYRLFNNIFVTTEPTTPENAFDVPQMPNTEAEIFALINSDLDFAIDNLEWTTTEFGRWTQASARHLRAKTAIWQKDWTEAATQAEAVINNENYSLVPTTAEVFANKFDHSETLFAMQLEEDAIGGGRRNRIHFNLIPQYNRLAGATYGPENGSRGAGFLYVNDYLRDLLAEDENDSRDDGTYHIRYYTYNDPVDLPDGIQIGDTINVFNQYDGEGREFYLHQGMGTLKYFQREAVPTEANTITNIMVFRLAETYLIAAEARMELGNDGQALTWLNAVRNRAGAADKTVIDQTLIMDERARELAFEGQRWFTLKRMGRLVEQIRLYAGNDNWRNAARERIEEWHVNWSIPEDELNLLGPNYPQNEGYTD